MVMGDPHGGYKAFIQCMERSGFDYEEDELILLGDVADGWSEVPELIEELLKIRNLISIMGNHDNWAYKWLKFGLVPALWADQGGKATINAYIRRPELKDKHLELFFSKQHYYYVDDNNRGFVHGGFISRKGLGHDFHQTSYLWDRDMWSIAMMSNGRLHLNEDGIPQTKRFYKHKEVFIGHTSTDNWKIKPHLPEYKDPNQKKNGGITVPMNRSNVWNLDTGGGNSFGKLTIMNINSKQYWQSDFVGELYLDEKGR